MPLESHKLNLNPYMETPQLHSGRAQYLFGPLEKLIFCNIAGHQADQNLQKHQTSGKKKNVRDFPSSAKKMGFEVMAWCGLSLTVGLSFCLWKRHADSTPVCLLPVRFLSFHADACPTTSQFADVRTCADKNPEESDKGKAILFCEKRWCFWGLVFATFNNIIFHEPKLAAVIETRQQRLCLKNWKGHIRKEWSDIIEEVTLKSLKAYKQSNYIWKPWYDLVQLNVCFTLKTVHLARAGAKNKFGFISANLGSPTHWPTLSRRANKVSVGT